MKSGALRRVSLFALVLLITAVFAWADFSLRTNLRPAATFSGIVLFVLVLALTAFNARKKLPFLPLAKASTWMQCHIYAGWLSVFLFLIHTGLRLPRGPLETTLALLFLAVSLSGFVGLALSRVLPARMTLHGEPLIFERIPAMRTALKQQVEDIVVRSLSVTRSSTIADFYEQRLRDYFERTRNHWSHLVANRQPLHSLTSQIQDLDRFCNAEERRIMDDIQDLVRRKDNLDFQRVNQGALKGWLLVHIPLTYALIAFAAVHGVLAWRFH